MPADIAFLLFGLALLLLFESSGASSTEGRWIFRTLFTAHVLTYIAMRRLHPGATGEPLLRLAPPQRPASRDLLVLGGLVAIALALRIPHLDEGPWFDEIDTLITYAREPFEGIVHSFHSRNQHMLYSVLAHASLLLFGESIWALRLPAVLFGVASLGALYELGRSLHRPGDALLSGALLAVSYQHIWFSQNARGYTGLLFWATLGTALFVHLLQAQRPRHELAWGYAIVLALGVFTHATAAFLGLTHFFLWLACAWRARRTTSTMGLFFPLVALTLAATLSALLYSQVLAKAREIVSPRRSLITASDVARAPATSPPVVAPADPPTYTADQSRGLVRAQRHVSWLVHQVRDRFLLWATYAWITAGLAGLCLLAGILAYASTDRIVAALLLSPPIVTFVLLFVSDQILFPRFFFFTLGFAILLLVRGLHAIPSWLGLPHPERIAGAIVGGLVLIALPNVPLAWAPKEDYAAARAYLHQHAGPDDAVIVMGMARLPLIKYHREPWIEEEDSGRIAAIAAQHERTWIVGTHIEQLHSRLPHVMARVKEEYDQAAVFPGTVGDGDIVIWVKKR